MSEENKAVETGVNAAPHLGVEAKSDVAPVSQQNFDLATELELVRKERDNYKQGLLKHKGKIDDFQSDEDLELKISSIVQKQIEERKNIELEQKEKQLLEQILKENRELKIAMQNRSQISVGTSQGASSEAYTQPKVNFFSEEQLAILRKRGLDPEKVRANIEKYK